MLRQSAGHSRAKKDTKSDVNGLWSLYVCRFVLLPQYLKYPGQIEQLP